MKKVLISVCCLAFLTIFGNYLLAQNVSNVNAVQEGYNIKITYDLDKAAQISVFFSSNGGAALQKLDKVSGDVGEKIVGPGHKTIVWDVLAEEGVDSLSSDRVVFMVNVDANAESEWRKMQRKEARKNMPFNTFVTLNAAYCPQPHWSAGFKIGQMKNVGWFVSLLSNFHFKGWKQPFEEGGDYWLTECKSTRLSAQVGLVVRPRKPISLLFGVGYGYRSLTYKDIDNEWYSYPKRTYQGVDASFGFLFDIKGVAFSAEAVSTNFKTIEARIGFGCRFPDKKHKKDKPLKF
jgi:hypothetical protein